MRWKWFEFHNWVIFLGGYLLNHNAHQPSAIGMVAAEYLFWFVIVWLVLTLPSVVHKLSAIWITQKTKDEKTRRK